MTGSATEFTEWRWTLQLTLLLGEKVIKKGGGLGEGGSKIGPGRTLADSESKHSVRYCRQNTEN